ncbi:MAG: sterol desaturase family protein [Myxococcales bacterium]|nr:sterol desaturase family protein [Myxococcales bacterium]
MDIGVPETVAGCGLLMLAIERLWPGHVQPRVPRWWPRAAAASALQAAAVYLAGATWDTWLQSHRPWSADGLGVLAGALAGYLAVTLVYYFWHRARHEVPLLWRLCHQLHHSPRRIEVITSFYKHPLEILLNGVLSSAILYGLVGLGPTAAALAVLATGVAELFYHWNVRTPHWLGFLIQRPESHRVHHERDRHRLNYSDLPLWDMLFGTFHNPRPRVIECGFAPEQEARVGAMLRGQQVAP